MLNEILNRKDFEWSKEADPNWSAYKKEYLREGDRATANALAQASAASGGRASSYAVNAAGQAGDYYAGQLADKIPELYQQAYERYLAEQQMKYSDLSALNSQEQLEYAKYLDSLNQWNTDRNFAYNDYQTQYNMLQNQLANFQGQQQTEFNQNLTTQQYLDELAQYQQEQRAAQINAILSAGGTPSADLMSGSGLSDEYVQAIAAEYARQDAEAKDAAARELADWYAAYGDYSQLAGLGVDTSVLKQMQAAQLASGSSSGSSGRSSGSSGDSESSGGTMTLTTAKQYASNGIFNDDVLAAFYKNGWNDELLAAEYGYAPTVGNGNGSGSDGSGHGTAYVGAVATARLMQANGATNQQIFDMLEKYSATQLTDKGLDSILSVLGINGY